METYIGTVVTAILMAVLSGHAATASSTKQSLIPVPEFVANDTIFGVLHRLAVKCHIVIGISGTVLGGEDRPIAIEMKNGTLAKVLIL